MNRSLPIFPLAHYKIKPGKMAYVKVRIPFVEKLCGIAIVKLLYKYHIGTMRVRIDHNHSIIKIINNTNETIYYSPQLSMGIVDIRSLGYYNVSKSILLFDKRGNDRIPPPPYGVPKLHPQQYYNKAGSSTEISCQLEKEQLGSENEKDPYPWLDLEDPRRDMSDNVPCKSFIVAIILKLCNYQKCPQLIKVQP